MKRSVLFLLFLFCLLPGSLFSQTYTAPITQTGEPAPMLAGAGTPLALNVPCGNTLDPFATYNMLPFYNITAAASRPIWLCNGITWVQAPPNIVLTTASFGGALILLGNNITQTVSIPGGAATGTHCEANRADGIFLAVGLSIDCQVTSGVATVRISAIIAGTPPAGTYTVTVFL